LNLSDNCQNQAQTNTVVVQQEKMDWVGVDTRPQPAYSNLAPSTVKWLWIGDGV
jgi:hypothetical protein